MKNYKYKVLRMLEGKASQEMDEKIKWLSDIGAVAYPEPVKYIYRFPEGNETFSLTERYVRDTPLSELKAKYERDRRMAEDAITSRKLLEQNRSTYYGLPETVSSRQSSE